MLKVITRCFARRSEYQVLCVVPLWVG